VRKGVVMEKATLEEVVVQSVKTVRGGGKETGTGLLEGALAGSVGKEGARAALEATAVMGAQEGMLEAQMAKDLLAAEAIRVAG